MIITNISVPLSKYLVNLVLPDISNDIDNIADIISTLNKQQFITYIIDSASTDSINKKITVPSNNIFSLYPSFFGSAENSAASIIDSNSNIDDNTIITISNMFIIYSF